MVAETHPVISIFAFVRSMFKTVSLTPASSQKEKETPGSVVVSEKVVKAMRGGAVASAQSSPSVVHTVTAQAAVSTPLPVTKQVFGVVSSATSYHVRKGVTQTYNWPRQRVFKLLRHLYLVTPYLY